MLSPAAAILALNGLLDSICVGGRGTDNILKIAKIIRDGCDQVVLLPTEFQLDCDEVLIKKVGEAIVLLPREAPWDSLISSLGKFTEDFMADRGRSTNDGCRESRR